MIKKAALTFLLSFVCAIALAGQSPLPSPYDARIKRVIFQENNVVAVHGNTFTSTQIIFSADETILNVDGGDTAGWIATFHKHLPNRLFLKPTLLGSNSNMTITTNKHDYYFHVMSNKTLTTDRNQQTYALQFLYPEEERKALNAKLKEGFPLKKQKATDTAVKVSNWSYGFSGNPRLKPQHVFDDGNFTYFQLTKDQPVPAVFAVDNPRGKESVVNTRQQGDYLVVLRTAPQFTLRNGPQFVASVFNYEQIAAIRQGRR